MHSPVLIHEFIRWVRAESGARSASVAMFIEPAESQPLLVIHDPDAHEALPELQDEASVWNEIKAERQRRDAASETPLIEVTPSCADDGLIIRINVGGVLQRPRQQARSDNERRSHPDINVAPNTDGAVWIGLSGCADADGFIRRIGGDAADPASLPMLAARLAWSVYQLTGSLQDPVSELPGRMEFQVHYKRALAAATLHGQPVSLMFINPDDFSMINHRYGRESGDLAVREIASYLAAGLRETDGVFHYGGAVFATVLHATDRVQCEQVAEKIRQHLVAATYVDGQERLTFSIGAGVASTDDLRDQHVDAALLLKQADTALNRAKLSGGASIVVRDASEDLLSDADVNPLSGVFTADTEKDYRNMLLLWETVALISSHPEPGEMAAAMVDRLATGFQPDRIVLFSVGENQELSQMASNVRDDKAPNGRATGQRVDLGVEQFELIRNATISQQAERYRSDPERSPHTATAYAVPLVARERVIGCIYLDAQGLRLQLDSSDVVFLNALAGQMAVALDRAALAAGWIREKDRESKQLREELNELRQSFSDRSMIYVSEQMHTLMETVKRVAPSDATVLITGESGTGKEKLAQAIHENSNRANAPFIVFDCGAVAHSLLEAELFGHIKGAFTGAESASEGRIAQADGGTLFLDEIGELPLQVQAKLLRFVQEKEYSPVGSGNSVVVDVRIVAATNRRLQDEVAAGAFRADLYYRLQVISLQALPLRQRLTDVVPLAKHFIGQFCFQNGMPGKSLSEQAEAFLLTHQWPGNVRELQHAMVRAVLTAPLDVIQPADIELLPESDHVVAPAAARPPAAPVAPVAPAAGEHRFAPERSNESVAAASSPQTLNAASEGDDGAGGYVPVDPWERLREELSHQISEAVKQNHSRPVPLGRWLTEDFVLAASDASDNVSRRAARLVGVPESTFRRHYEKAAAELRAGLNNRTQHWERVRPLIEHLVQLSRQEGGEAETDLIDAARLVLLDDVREHVNERVSLGAALMGVTAPTYKRWLKMTEQP